MDSQAHYLQQFANAAHARSAEPSWLRARREAALADFQRLGFPSQKLEDWRYTNVREISETPFVLTTPKTVGSLSSASREALQDPSFDRGPRIVFVNGIFSAELSALDSSPKGLRVESLCAAPQRDTERLIEENLGQHLADNLSSFAALNTALFQDGVFVHLARGLVLEHPIQILHLLDTTLSDGESACFSRNLYLLEPDSHATIVETVLNFGDTRFLCNAITEIVVSRGASLKHVVLQRGNATSLHVSATQVRQDAASRFESISILLGGKLARSDLRSLLNAERAECKMRGLYAACQHQLVDQHTFVSHEKPLCTSEGYYKGILADRAHGVFNGRVIVQPHAQKTSSLQSNKNLLLSDGAEIDSKPELIIHADDVKCAHGSTTGSLSEDSLFYLRSRGLSEDEAKNLLTRAFAAEITALLPSEHLRHRTDAWLTEYFAEHFLSDGNSNKKPIGVTS